MFQLKSKVKLNRWHVSPCGATRWLYEQTDDPCLIRHIGKYNRCSLGKYLRRKKFTSALNMFPHTFEKKDWAGRPRCLCQPTSQWKAIHPTKKQDVRSSYWERLIGSKAKLKLNRSVIEYMICGKHMCSANPSDTKSWTGDMYCLISC